MVPSRRIGDQPAVDPWRVGGAIDQFREEKVVEAKEELLAQVNPVGLRGELAVGDKITRGQVQEVVRKGAPEMVLVVRGLRIAWENGEVLHPVEAQEVGLWRQMLGKQSREHSRWTPVCGGGDDPRRDRGK